MSKNKETAQESLNQKETTERVNQAETAMRGPSVAESTREFSVLTIYFGDCVVVNISITHRVVIGVLASRCLLDNVSRRPISYCSSLVHQERGALAES